MLMLTSKGLPTYLLLTSVDILLSTYLPPLVNVVFGQPLYGKMQEIFFCIVSKDFFSSKMFLLCIKRIYSEDKTKWFHGYHIFPFYKPQFLKEISFIFHIQNVQMRFTQFIWLKKLHILKKSAKNIWWGPFGF